MAAIRGSSVALNEVLDVTVDDVCNVLATRPVDVQLCRERLSGLMRSVIRMWSPEHSGHSAASLAKQAQDQSDAMNSTAASRASAAPPKLTLHPPPPRLVDAVPNFVDFLMHVSNLPNVDSTAENMMWNLLFRLLMWVPTWPQRVANYLLSRLYFFLHSARRQLDRLTDAHERLGAPKWLYDVHVVGGAPLDSEVAVWCCALLMYKLPASSVRVMLAPPWDSSCPQSAPFVKLLRKIAVDVALFTVSRVRNDCMPEFSFELSTFPVPSLDPATQAAQAAMSDPKTKAFSRVPLEAMWLLARAMRTATLALHDGVGSIMPEHMGAGGASDPAVPSNQSVSSAGGISASGSSAAMYLFGQEDDDDAASASASPADRYGPRSPSSPGYGGNNSTRGPSGAAAHNGGPMDSTRVGGASVVNPPANSKQYQEQMGKEHRRSLCCHAAWLGAVRILSSVVHTAVFELLAKRPDSGHDALTQEEVREAQAKPMFRAMGAVPAIPMMDDDLGSALATLVHVIVRPKPYRKVVLASVSQLCRCAVSLCAIDGLSRHVRGRQSHPAIARATLELLAAGVHHPNHQLLEHSLTQSLAEVYMMHKGIQQRYYVSVPDISCIVGRVMDVTTEFEQALRSAYPTLFAVGHPYYEGWQNVVRVASWLNETCVEDKPRRGEPMWQLSLYFLRHGRADQAAMDPVAKRFGQRIPNADEYFSMHSHREFAALKQAEANAADSQAGGADGSGGGGLNVHETAFAFTTALRWGGVDEWEEQMDRIELRGSVAGSRATLDAYLSAQQAAVDSMANSVPSTSRRDAAFRNRLHKLMQEQRTVQTLVRDGHTSFATTAGGYTPSPSMTASLCFFNDILEWCTANNALDVAIEYTEAYVGVIDNLSGNAGVASSISSGLLQLDALADKKRSALLVGLQAHQWNMWRLCDVVEGSRIAGLMENLFDMQ